MRYDIVAPSPASAGGWWFTGGFLLGCILMFNIATPREMEAGPCIEVIVGAGDAARHDDSPVGTIVLTADTSLMSEHWRVCDGSAVVDDEVRRVLGDHLPKLATLVATTGMRWTLAAPREGDAVWVKVTPMIRCK